MLILAFIVFAFGVFSFAHYYQSLRLPLFVNIVSIIVIRKFLCPFSSAAAAAADHRKSGSAACVCVCVCV